ncbi:hypothetical protein [Methanobrevibacter sp.]|uniref:hypothetical protein n=1 Tax=Methanobrevibacter sp. TaxID=66852 RepID=UPI003890B65A
MVKMEIELTEEQLDKVKQLEKHDISVGQAIDMLFEAKEETLALVEDIETAGILGKIKDTTLDVDDKAKVLDGNYGDSEESYEEKVRDIKHKVSWAKDIFKF